MNEKENQQPAEQHDYTKDADGNNIPYPVHPSYNVPDTEFGENNE